MKIVALLTVRNEMLYLPRCLDHLRSQGVDVCVIDNASTDGSADHARSRLGKGVLSVEELPFVGTFDLPSVLRNEERLARTIRADWFIHHDADEIREAPPGEGTLAQALERAATKGYNAVDFDEFVFLPAEGEDHAGQDYVRTMKRYYFFKPHERRRVNAWRPGAATVDLVSSGGHQARFEGQKISPEAFILRHYPILSRTHMAQKYGQRRYAAEALDRGWFRDHRSFDERLARLPADDEMKKVGDTWDRSDPKKRHPHLVGSF